MEDQNSILSSPVIQFFFFSFFVFFFHIVEFFSFFFFFQVNISEVEGYLYVVADKLAKDQKMTLVGNEIKIESSSLNFTRLIPLSIDLRNFKQIPTIETSLYQQLRFWKLPKPIDFEPERERELVERQKQLRLKMSDILFQIQQIHNIPTSNFELDREKDIIKRQAQLLFKHLQISHQICFDNKDQLLNILID